MAGRYSGSGWKAIGSVERKRSAAGRRAGGLSVARHPARIKAWRKGNLRRRGVRAGRVDQTLPDVGSQPAAAAATLASVRRRLSLWLRRANDFQAVAALSAKKKLCLAG